MKKNYKWTKLSWEDKLPRPSGQGQKGGGLWKQRSSKWVNRKAHAVRTGRSGLKASHAGPSGCTEAPHKFPVLASILAPDLGGA